MKIRFIGVGTQSAGTDQYNSNMVITSRTGKRMLVDCGVDARFSLADSGLGPEDIEAVYLSHLHSDHIGGMEWLALSTYFAQERRRLELFGEEHLLDRLWEHSLKGGIECMRSKRMELADYFECRGLAVGTPFLWEGIRFEMVRMLHIAGDQCQHDSYGLLVGSDRAVEPSLFISMDAIFQPELLQDIADKVDLIFHDCETIPYRTGVHAHYDELCTLPASIRGKMWLYHYQAAPAQIPRNDGLLGFIVKGQEFSFPD
jgi:ribonuclease BN (tRNA processing enzyme)